MTKLIIAFRNLGERLKKKE